MADAVTIRVKIKPYRWHEFVHDVCFVLYAVIMISNALSRRYFTLSLGQLFRLIRRYLNRAFWIFMLSVWGYLIIGGVLGWR